MSKQLALKQSGWNRSTVEFYECPLLAPAAFVDGARNQLLPRAGFAEKKYGRVTGSHGFDQIQDMAQSRTLPHNSFEIHLAADFVFQIQLFLRQLVFEISDLAVRQRVLHTDRHLLCHLGEELRLLRVESIFFPARQGEHAKQTASADESHVAQRINALPCRLGVRLRWHLGRIK